MNTKVANQQGSVSFLSRFLGSIFKFFASLKLAILVIVSLMVIMAVGTIIESLHGADAAKLVVYESLWFHVVLFFLGVNVAAAALDRLPWKTKHVGFVITHVGIILILIGSFVSQVGMIDGQMVMAEGETDYRITLPEPLLYVFDEEKNRDWILPLDKKPFPWSGEEKLKSRKKLPLDLSLTHYYPQSHLREDVVAANQGSAAIKVNIKNSFLDQTLWLIENDPKLGRIPMGPAIFSFAAEALQESKPVNEETYYLEFQFQKQNVRIPVEEKMELPATFPLDGTPYSVEIKSVYKKAQVVGKELIENEAPNGVENPAVVLMLRGNGIEEKHTTFTKFPEFPTMHGMQASQAGAKIFYRKPNSGSKGETHELRFLKTESGFQYQIQDGFKVTTHEGKVGEDVSLGWMDLKFNAEVFYPQAEVIRTYDPAPNTTESETATPAIEIKIQKDNQSEKIWLAQGKLQVLNLGGREYHFLYGQRRIPTSFKLTLEDFRVEQYPGTNQPASFESDVVLKDDMNGIQKEVTISMNEPLEHQGFKVYQSGYTFDPDGKEISIFAVGRDPGIPLKYFGTIVMVIGIVTMFFTRRFSSRAGRLG